MFRDENVVLFLVGNIGWHVLGGFSHFCWSDFLALAAHVPLLIFLRLREVLGDVFYIDEWPGEIISFADSLEPRGFCWEACHAVEVPNGWLIAGEFVYVVEVLLAMILAHLQCHVFAGELVGFNGVHGVEAVLTGWMIQDEGVCVEVGDEGDQGGAPKVHAGASPSFENRVCRDRDFGGACVVDVLVIDGRVATLANLLVLRSELPTSEGTMLTSRVGVRTLWSNLLTVVAGATAPFGRWNTMEDTHPVGRDGSDVRKVLNVAPVLLTADGIVPFNTPMYILR